MRRWAGLLPVLALVSGLPAHAAELSNKVFRDWVAGCDNLNLCVAMSLPGEAAPTQMAYLRLERKAGPNAAPKLVINLRDDAKFERRYAAELSLDGTPFPTAGRRFDGTSWGDETGEIELSSDDIAALIASARKAEKLELRFDDKRFTISLAGAVAALLLIDERQGRLGTVDALIRKGGAPATSVPPEPKKPVIGVRATDTLPKIDAKAARALTTALRARVKAEPCGDLESVNTNEDRVFPLDATHRLIALHCGLGAYNSATGYWIAGGNSGANARPASFPGRKDNVLVNTDFDPRTTEISYYGKDRGVGDCGSAGGYAWTGSAFVVTRLSAMEVCRGLPPDEWTTLFRSEIRVMK